MGQATTHLTKGKLIGNIDKCLEQPVQAFADELESETSMFDLGLQKTVVGPSDEAHCEGEFMGDAGDANAFWPHIDKKQEIIRGAYWKAINLAIKDENGNPYPSPKPVITYWVRGLPQGVFEVAVSETEREVHVIWITEGKPMVQIVPEALSPEDQKLWLVGEEGKIQTLFDKYPAAWLPEAPEPCAAIPGVRSFKLPSY